MRTSGGRGQSLTSSDLLIGIIISFAMTLQMGACPAPLLDRMPDHRRELLHQTIGHLAGHRELAVALEFRDRGLRVRADRAGRLQLAVAILGERTLHRGHPTRAGALR